MCLRELGRRKVVKMERYHFGMKEPRVLVHRKLFARGPENFVLPGRGVSELQANCSKCQIILAIRVSKLLCCFQNDVDSTSHRLSSAQTRVRRWRIYECCVAMFWR